MDLTDQEGRVYQRARLEVPSIDVLTPDKLIEAIESAGEPKATGGGAPGRRSTPAAAPQRAERDEPQDGGGGGRTRDRGRSAASSDRTPQGYGFRGARSGGALACSASQIRRCRAAQATEAGRPARPPRRGAPSRAGPHRVGQRPEPRGEAAPLRGPHPGAAESAQVPAGTSWTRWRAPSACLALRAAGASSSPRSGRTTLLRALDSAIAGTHAYPGRRRAARGGPQSWEQALPKAEIFAATADEEPREQVREA